MTSVPRGIRNLAFNLRYSYGNEYQIMEKPLLQDGIKKSYMSVYPSNLQQSTDKVAIEMRKTDASGECVGVDPLTANRRVPHPTSNIETIIHILKTNIGTGVLALPQAFIHSGLAFGTVGLALIGVMCVHCMNMLVNCSQNLCVRTRGPGVDYATTAEYAFKYGPRRVQGFAPWGRFLTNMVIVITQLGFCVVYFIFVASNIQSIIQQVNPSMVWDYRVYMALIALPLGSLIFVNNLKYLTPFSMFGNVCEVVAFVLLFYYLFQDIPPVSTRPQVPTLAGLPLWFGTTIYAYEGIALILPLENSMRYPREMPGPTGVLVTSMNLVTILYLSVSFFGYLRFGDALQGSITMSLPPGPISIIIQAAYAAGIFFSFPLQIFIPIQIMWPSIESRIPRYKKVAEMCFRILLFIFIFALGAIIPKFELFISLVGAFGGSYLSIIFPAALHIVTFWDESGWKIVTKDSIIIFIGVIGFITGTYSSVLSIVQAF